ncbi:MAG TPA: beta-ketoacyl-ACP synthase III [Pirellulales bacterium]|jgi:3-oxoacyl-[acyl-carrier-protein] synthase-3|nr:beta-ketoacyl-ACP synthase III [Pirellulales bacterium]
MGDGKTNVLSTAPLRRLMGVQIVATGGYVPDPIVTNDELAAPLGLDPAWILQRTGIRERRQAPAEMATSDLAIRAAQRAMERAGATAADIDLVLVGTFTPDMPFPATACLVQDRLGIRAPAVDLQAACAGFMYALITGAQFIATGCSKLALVIGADCNSRVLNPKDTRTYPLFGDGAGAVLLAPGGPEQGLVAYTLGADGSGGPLLCRPMSGSRMPIQAAMLDEGLQYLQMDGPAVFKWAVQIVVESGGDVLAAAGMSAGDIDLAVLHQANIRIIYTATDLLGIDRDRVMVNLDRYGNTSAGSIPLALDDAFQQGRIAPGRRLLLSGFGGGLTWGTAVWRW